MQVLPHASLCETGDTIELHSYVSLTIYRPGSTFQIHSFRGSKRVSLLCHISGRYDAEHRDAAANGERGAEAQLVQTPAMAVDWVVAGVLTVLGAFYNVVKCIQMDNVRFCYDISPSQVLGKDMNM